MPEQSSEKHIIDADVPRAAELGRNIVEQELFSRPAAVEELGEEVVSQTVQEKYPRLSMGDAVHVVVPDYDQNGNILDTVNVQLWTVESFANIKGITMAKIVSPKRETSYIPEDSPVSGPGMVRIGFPE